MNARPFPELLADLDAELALADSTGSAADQILDRLEARAPGAVMRSAARLQLQSLGCSLMGDE